MEASNCPTCGAPLPPTSEWCEFYGQYIQRPAAPVQKTEERVLPAWTQGISPEGFSNGSFDVKDIPAMSLSQALGLLERLPIPPRVNDPGNYCPPALGFGERNISRMEDGKYLLWPEDRSCSLEEAQKVVKQIYGVVT